MLFSKRRIAFFLIPLFLLVAVALIFLLSSRCSDLQWHDACILKVDKNSVLVYVKSANPKENNWSLTHLNYQEESLEIFDAHGKPFTGKLMPWQMIQFGQDKNGMVLAVYPTIHTNVVQIRLLDSYSPSPQFLYEQGMQHLAKFQKSITETSP